MTRVQAPPTGISRQSRLRRLVAVSVALVLLPAAGLLGAEAVASAPTPVDAPVPRAQCGPGSNPETGLQGQVSLRDRESGRSRLGYTCNVSRLGQYQGQGTTWVSASYGRCAYHAQAFPSSLRGSRPGVHVVDVSDVRRPRLARTLTSPAFAGNTWETLKVNEARGLLAGVFVGSSNAAAFFDVYDVKGDCRNPRLLNSLPLGQLSRPANTVGHEGSWSPDGRTYWATSSSGGLLTAIDVSDPKAPRVLWTGPTNPVNHGLSLSPDGERLYLAAAGLGGVPNGMEVYDVGSIQRRDPVMRAERLGATYWEDGQAGQHALSVSYGGRPHVWFVDELGQGAPRLIDVGDPRRPQVRRTIKLEIQRPAHESIRATDLAGTGLFGYDAHYCNVDRPRDPRRLACGYFNSGVRVFDVTQPLQPREVGYYNPRAQVGKNDQLPGSEHASSAPTGSAPRTSLTADWCSSPPRFVGPDQLWVTCQDNGFLVLQLKGRAVVPR